MNRDGSLVSGNPEPLIVTRVPPESDPLLGLMELMVKACDFAATVVA